jgi:hypothetical protein
LKMYLWEGGLARDWSLWFQNPRQILRPLDIVYSDRITKSVASNNDNVTVIAPTSSGRSCEVLDSDLKALNQTLFAIVPPSPS